MYRTPFNVDVGPGKGTYLPDPQSGAQADVDAEVPEGEVRHEVVHDLLLVRTCQDLEAAGALNVSHTAACRLSRARRLP